jgi:hypothetical protein
MLLVRLLARKVRYVVVVERQIARGTQISNVGSWVAQVRLHRQ